MQSKNFVKGSEGRLKVGDQGEKPPGSPAFLAIREDNSCC